MNFVADQFIKDKAYPNLATWQAQPYTNEWRQFTNHYPFTVPVNLYDYCNTHGVSHNLYQLKESWPVGSFYTVAFGFFNFGIDYFELLKPEVVEHVKSGRLKILFYYHEGDNPSHIKQRLDSLCDQHGINKQCYKFVSGNTAAENIPGFYYFPCHELLYWHRNKDILATPTHTNVRSKDFTALNRTHKWWRATVMADLHRQHLLDNSYWSYRTDITVNDDPLDNPIEVDEFPQLRWAIDKFLKGAPYQCDSLTPEEHNDHHLLETSHFTDSYCHLILETHFDADGSGGSFLTEKTFKVLKHGQPFIMFGPAGTLAKLRELGYKTFDHAIDNSYDLETDNTQRYKKIVKVIKDLKQKDLHAWFLSCLDDVQHNQNLFVSTKANRVNNLLERLK